MRIFEIDGYKYMAYGRPFKRKRKKTERSLREFRKSSKRKKIKGKTCKFMRDKPLKH